MTETRYRREFSDEVCRRLAEGASLREVCREHGVPESSVREWVRDNRDNFAARYQTARFLQVEAWSDLIIEIGNREDLCTASACRCKCERSEGNVKQWASTAFSFLQKIGKSLMLPVAILPSAVIAMLMSTNGNPGFFFFAITKLLLAYDFTK